MVGMGIPPPWWLPSLDRQNTGGTVEMNGEEEVEPEIAAETSNDP